jgi:hypothetical protein
MKFSFYFLFILIIAWSACNRKSCANNTSNIKDQKIPELPRFQKKLVTADTLQQNIDTLIFYQRSACFGFCPTFNYLVYQNGVVHYNGIQHVEPLGKQYGLIADSWWKEVAMQLSNSGFFVLENVYPTDPKMYIPDLPNTIIIIKDGGKRKSIIDNHDAPKPLKDFEIFLEEKFRMIDFNKL